MPKSGTVTMYGIKNCDTMKKARTWLDQRSIAYVFHDYKTMGLERSKLQDWARQVGWEALLNRTGTTFRKLSETHKQSLSQEKAISLMLEQPSIIKRPVLELGGGLVVGFKPELYEKSLAAS